MVLFKLFPACSDMVDASAAARLDRRFQDECARSGIALNSQAAERIGVTLLTDCLSGLPPVEFNAPCWLMAAERPEGTPAPADRR